jgi:putative hydrolase of the HAD superfamily
MRAVLFDLDDTLYPELEFVESGFHAVANYLGSRFNLDENSLLTRIKEIFHRDGRGKIFDTLLRDFGMDREEEIRLLVYIYRSHKPTLHAFADSLPLIYRLKENGNRLGIITDGMASVQRRKISALGFSELFDAIVCTDEIGREYWKPSVIPYKVALNLLRVEPSEATYVGNDLSKDFQGANSLGMQTIQLERSSPRECRRTNSADCSKSVFVVNTLDEIWSIVGENNYA